MAHVSHAYDSHGRVASSTDARNGATFYTYNAADQMVSVTAPVPGTGEPAQLTTTFYDTLGRVIGQHLPDGVTTTNQYFQTGLLKKTWGARRVGLAPGVLDPGRETGAFIPLPLIPLSLPTGSVLGPVSLGWSRKGASSLDIEHLLGAHEIASRLEQKRGNGVEIRR